MPKYTPAIYGTVGLQVAVNDPVAPVLLKLAAIVLTMTRYLSAIDVSVGCCCVSARC